MTEARRVTGHGRLFATATATSTMIAMKPRGKLVALSTAAVGVVVLVATGFAAKDRILETWWLHELRVGNELEQEASARTLVNIQSAKAIPGIGDLFVKACKKPRDKNKTRRLQWTFQALLSLGGPRVVTQVVSGEQAEMRECCLDAIRNFECPMVIPIFVPFVHDVSTQVRAVAAAALGQCQVNSGSFSEEEISAYVAALRQLLTDDSASIRAKVVRDLVYFGPKLAPAIPELIATLRDQNETVVSNASEALGRIGVEAVRPLLIALSDPAPRVRESAADAIYYVGSDAAPAVPRLADLLSDADPDVRAVAALALGQIGPAARPAIRQLAQTLVQPQLKTLRCKPTQLFAAEALWKIDKRADLAVPVLVELTCDPDWSCASESLSTLSEMGPSAIKAVPRLTEMLTSEGSRLSRAGDLRVYAAAALWRINQSAELILPILVKTLSDPNSPALPLVIRVLEEIGPPAKAAVPALIDLLASDTMRIPGAALKALQSIEAPPTEAKP